MIVEDGPVGGVQARLAKIAAASIPASAAAAAGLFLAGIVPGIIMGITMMLTVAYFAHTRNYGRDVPFSAARLAKAR